MISFFDARSRAWWFMRYVSGHFCGQEKAGVTLKTLFVGRRRVGAFGRGIGVFPFIRDRFSLLLVVFYNVIFLLLFMFVVLSAIPAGCGLFFPA
jgi:hypothetical protein